MLNRNNNARNGNNSNAKIRYFNAHTEAFGYINGIREVTPQPGQKQFDPFWATTFCMLEGDPQNPIKKYINITIVNPKMVELLLEFEQELNSEVPVFANARLASVNAEPFVYGDNSKNAGQLGINWSGKMISLLYLKVGDQVIDLGRNQEPSTDYGVSASQSQQYSNNRNNRSQGNHQGDSGNRQGRQYSQRQGNGGSRPQGNFRQSQSSNGGYQSRQGGQNFGKSNRPTQSQGNHQQY